MHQRIKSPKRVLFIALLLLYTTAAYSEEEKVFTWTDCVREAFNNNPDLMSAGETVRQSEEDGKIAQSVRMPRISAEASGRRSESAITEKQTDSYYYGVSGEQLLFDGFKTSNDIKETEEITRAARYNSSVVSSNVRLELRTAFVELLHAQELISLTENIATRRKQNLELVKLRYEAGREHRGSLLTAEADLAQAEFEVVQAGRNIPLRQRQLVKGIGFDKMKPIKVHGEFSVTGNYSVMPDIEQIAGTTPFLKELMARKEAAQYNLRSAKADLFPKVYLSGAAGRASSDFPPDENEWSAGLSMSLPLFEGGRRTAKVRKAESLRRQADADNRSGKDSILVTLETMWKDLQDSITKVSVQKKFLDAAEERARIAGAQYETGQISFNDWIIIENNLVSARKSYLNARSDMLLAEAYWIQSAGGTLEDDEK